VEKKVSKYYNRDLSWLKFNHRVLQEMMDERNPLLERFKFAAIFSSNMEEFFEVRISSIRRIKSFDKSLRKKLITKPNKLLRKIKKEINILEKTFREGLFDILIPELKKAGYSILRPSEFNEKVKDFCVNYFNEHLKNSIEDKSVFNTDQERLFIKSGKVYLAGLKDNKLHVYALPKDQQRFVQIELDGTKHYIFLDDLIKENLLKIHNTEYYSFTASRDAELYIEDEYAGNLKEKIVEALSNRETGQFSTTMVEEGVLKKYLTLLYEALDITATDIIIGGKYHRLKDLFTLDFLESKEHQMVHLEPLKSDMLSCQACIFDAIKEKDVLLYYPYDSFDQVIRFVNEASVDPYVTSIKATLYRVSKTSQIAQGLLNALNNGKSVCVFIETKARFDESNNVYWGDKLSEAGANVIYSYPEIKVHSKVMYVQSMTENGPKDYAYIGTGNFNEKTARIYTDYGLMTSRKKITKEVGRIFKLLEGKVLVPKVQRLLVSPFNTRSKITGLILQEIEQATLGNDAYLIFKMNSLEDKEMIKILYKASTAGVKIKLMIRGICCLVPGLEGISENIEVISIVDRFLEHGRVYIFGNGGKEIMYIGSADLMTRNLDNRIEVLVPIQDESAFLKIRYTIDIQFKDNVKARIIDANQSNEYVGDSNEYINSSQHKIYDYLKRINNIKNP